MFFKADAILADRLFEEGFKETTDEEYKRKGKREFSKGKKRVRFDYINIITFIKQSDNHHGTQIDESELYSFLNA